MKLADERDALRAKLQTFETKAQAAKESERRAWVGSMVQSGRVKTRDAQNLLDILTGLEREEIVIRSYEYGRHTAWRGATLLKRIFEAYPEGIQHQGQADERLYSDPVAELDTRAQLLKANLGIGYEEAAATVLKEDVSLRRQYAAKSQ
jgi:hypothetical protein